MIGFLGEFLIALLIVIGIVASVAVLVIMVVGVFTLYAFIMEWWRGY